MKNKLAVGGLVVALLSTIITGVEMYGKNKSNNLGEKVVVTSIVDGDTFDTNNGMRVRMYGINAPEYPEGCLALDSKERLSDLILNKEIKMINKGRDSFGRSLGMIYVGKLSINKVLINEGLAVYEGKTDPDDKELLEMEQANSEAKLAKRELWSSKCSQPNDKCVIKGNYQRTNKTNIYTLPDCYNYDKIIVDPTGRDKWFCSEAEAIKAGFKKSQDCPGYK